MNGLDPTAPAPERRPRMIDLFTGPDKPESDGPLPDWLPHRDGPRSPPTPGQTRISLDVEDAEPSTSALDAAH